MLQTTSGNITFTGTGGDGTTVIMGIYFTGNGTVMTTADGDIALTGTGGDGSGDRNHRHFVEHGADITSTGTGAGAGTITLTGTGGDGTRVDLGVVDRDAGTTITTVDGDIEITGNGMGGGGFFMASLPQYRRAGDPPAPAWMRPISRSPGRAATTAKTVPRVSTPGAPAVQTVDGNITLTGTGGDGTGSVIMAFLSAAAASALHGSITITGEGGDGTFGNYGIYVASSALLSTVDGDIQVNGTGGMGTGIANEGSLPRHRGSHRNGNITLDGTAGSGTGELRRTTGNVGGTCDITAMDGDITIIGDVAAGGTSFENIGVGILIGVDVATTGTGDIDITGSGGDDGSRDNYGVRIADAGANTSITTVDGEYRYRWHGGRRLTPRTIMAYSSMTAWSSNPPARAISPSPARAGMEQAPITACT